jgi:large subunit ribosomal protein L15
VHKGFLPTQGRTQTNTINVGELEHLLLDTDQEILDLTSLGFEKLLGRGQIRVPVKVKVPSYSIKALEKIESSGGSILE